MNADLSAYLTWGGVAAAMALLAACWRQARTVFGYIASFVVVQVRLDRTTQDAVRVYLKRHYRPLPSGLLHYVSQLFNVKGRRTGVLVPFRPTANKAIYMRGFRVLIVSFGYKSSITAIRGTVDFDALVCEAIDYWEAQRNSAGVDEMSRYHVIRIIGREKTLGGSFDLNRLQPRGDQAVGTAGQAPTAAPPESGEEPAIDYGEDVSIKYARQFYIFDEKASDPLEGLYFDREVLDVVRQAETWAQSGEWYADRGIPWRRGVLLHGPAGTGKSTLGMVIAKKLRVPVYQFFLSTLSDQEFMEAWAGMATPCVAQVDDLDTVWNKRESLTVHKTLTFDCFLNQISGISALQGVFLVATTNHLDRIDEALGNPGANGMASRPGRIDAVVRVGKIGRENRVRMASSILRDWPSEQPSVVARGDDMTPAQFQELCIQTAYDRIADGGLPAQQMAAD